jgi:hypothetical protein
MEIEKRHYSSPIVHMDVGQTEMWYQLKPTHQNGDVDTVPRLSSR